VIIRHTLGGTPVTIYCPMPGGIDPFAEVTILPTSGEILNGLDVESTGLEPSGIHHPDWRMRTAQFAPYDDVAYVLRMDDPDAADLARTVLSNPRATFASHMRIDPEAVKVALGVDVTDRFIDTHVMAIMAAPDAAAGQGSLKPAATRFNMPELEAAEEALTARFDTLYREAHPEIGRRAIKAKELKKWGFTHVPLDDPDFLLYAGLDAIAARRLVPLLASASEAPAHVLTTERWLSQVAARTVRRGMRVDRDRLAEVIASSDAEATAASEITMEVCGLKPSQGVKLQAWWGEHGVDWTTWPDEARTETGGPSLAKDNIKLLLRQPLDEAGRMVADAYARYSRVLDRNRRTKELLQVMDPDGYVHPGLSTVGTVTSRMACSAPNMQNFSKKDHVMRGLFLPEDGHVLMSCDFAQVELRVVASLAGEQTMIDTILAGGDLHQLTADLLGVTRQEAKTINFLIVYGGGGPVLAQKLGFSRTVAECRQIIRDYWAKYPAIAALNEGLTHESSVRLISGRLVPASQGRGYALMNYLIQGSSREILVGACRRFSGGDPELERMFWMWIHDEVVLQVPMSRTDEVAERIGSAMSLDLYGVPIVAEADVLLDENGESRWMSGDHAKKIKSDLLVS
jgi:DNA polymerase-1